MRGMRRLLLCLALVVGACGGGHKAGFSEPCGDGCADGLYCVKGGDMKGLCSVDCPDNNLDICTKRYGDNAYCRIGNICALGCDNSSCPAGTECDSSGSPSTCLASP